MNARQRRRFWIAEANKRRRIVDDYSGKFLRALSKDTQPFLEAFQEGGSRSAQAYINSLLISSNILNLMRSMYLNVGARFAKDEFKRLNVEQVKNFSTLEEWLNAIMQYIGSDFYNNGVLRISETTRAILTTILDKSIAEGWGYKETAALFYDTIPGINRNRAEMIARTESGKAIHAGRNVGASQSKWEQEKTWIAGKDSRTRGNPFNGQQDKADHYHLDGQTVDFNDQFFDSRANEFLNHPHDSKASAKSVIRCRCTFSVVNKLDANGRLIRKPNFSRPIPSILTPSTIQPRPKPQQFVPAKTREDAIKRINELGTKVDSKSINIEHLNKTLEALEIVPTKARPTIVTDKSGYNKITGLKVKRKDDQWNGMVFLGEVFNREERQFRNESIFIVNTSFKTLGSITDKKIKYNEYYSSVKNGSKWYFNEFDGSTHYHEMGHVFDRNISTKPDWIELANKWHKESKIDMIKPANSEWGGLNGGEAFAEAFASYFGNKKKGLPDYIVNYLDKILQ